MEYGLMPKSGDKFYRVGGDALKQEMFRLETVTFVEESIAEGASVHTYVMRGSDNRRFRCSIDMYQPTAWRAWQEARKSSQNAIRYGVQAVQAALDNLVYIQALDRQAELAIRELEYGSQNKPV
jgi:hypothetical protein